MQPKKWLQGDRLATSRLQLGVWSFEPEDRDGGHHEHQGFNHAIAGSHNLPVLSESSMRKQTPADHLLTLRTTRREA